MITSKLKRLFSWLSRGSRASTIVVHIQKAEVCVFITKKNRRYLSDMGYTRQQIDAMKPADAREILRKEGLM